MAYKGKIGSFPADIREEINHRLHNGKSSTEILPWLNVQPSVIDVLEDRWEGKHVTPQNLSEWRNGGYQDWLERRHKTEHLKTLAHWSVNMAEGVSAANLTSGSQTIIAGKLLEMVEVMEEEDIEKLVEALGGISLSVDRSQKIALTREQIALRREQNELREKELTLTRERFETQTVEKFLQFAKQKEAQAILTSGKTQHIQASLLRELMFGPVEPQTKEG